MHLIKRKRRILRNWLVLIAVLTGIAGCTVITSPEPPAEPASDTLTAWTYEQAVEQCNTLEVEWIQPCLTAAANTDWNN